MLTKIRTIDDVKDFAKQIIAESVSFHPDEDFNNYVNLIENKPCYSKQEANFRNELMNDCFEVCKLAGVDIYNLMLEVSLIETGINKLIPLPSQSIN